MVWTKLAGTTLVAIALLTSWVVSSGSEAQVDHDPEPGTKIGGFGVCMESKRTQTVSESEKENISLHCI